MPKIPVFNTVLPLLFLWPTGRAIFWDCAFHESLASKRSSGSPNLEDKVFKKVLRVIIISERNRFGKLSIVNEINYIVFIL